MNFFDMHCDTMMLGWENPGFRIESGDSAVNLYRLRENGAVAQCFALFLEWKEKGRDPYDVFHSMYQYYEKVMAEHEDQIRPALTVADIERNVADGVVSSVLTVEDGAFLDGKIQRLAEAYDMGVRLITLTWNYENSLGYPNSRDWERHRLGLKPFGIEVVEEMNRMGMMVDVSHLSEGGFFDVARYSRVPFCASHSCARALCNHPRNLTDEQLKVLGNAGGIVGVNFEKSFLNENGREATFDRVIEHLLYMKNRAGIDAVALGSDFDGIEPGGEIRTYDDLPKLTEAMTRYFSDEEIEKITHKNVLRFVHDVMGR